MGIHIDTRHIKTDKKKNVMEGKVNYKCLSTLKKRNRNVKPAVMNKNTTP